MKAVVQRVTAAWIEVAGAEVSRVGKGLLVLLGVAVTDTEKEARELSGKVAALRIFEDGSGKMNLSVLDVGGEVLVVSQFTLYGDCRRGRRPDFQGAAPGHVAEPLYKVFCEELRAGGVPAETGVFGAKMNVGLVNDGPVTLIVEKP